MITLRLFDEDDPFRPAASRTLISGELSVGRDAGADWPIDDPERVLSRIHCVFAVDDDGDVSVRDTSTNGVFDETGARLPSNEPCLLAIGTSVRIGNFMIVVDRRQASKEDNAPQDFARLLEPGAPRPIGLIASPPPPAAAMTGDGILIEAFAEGAQIDASMLAGRDPAELLRVLGAIYRETTLGLSQMMSERSAHRHELEVDRTTIGAALNNPFKWAPGPRVAVDLLRDRNDAFLSGADAVASSFADLREHIASLVAAPESAVAATLTALDPAAIEEDVGNQGLFAAGRAAACWRRFQVLHHSLTGARGARR